jgi:hypothetical protein
MPIAVIYFQLTQRTNVGIGFPFHNQSLHHTSRLFFRSFLLAHKDKSSQSEPIASSSELDIFQAQTGACSSVLVPCGGEGILCVLVQKDLSCKLVKLAVTCVAALMCALTASQIQSSKLLLVLDSRVMLPLLTSWCFHATLTSLSP